MMLKKFLMASAALAVAAGPLAGASKQVFSRVGRTGTPPVIDGTIDAGEWDGAARLSRFCDGNTGRPAARPTEVYVQYDDLHLYVAFRAEIDFEPIVEAVPHDNLDILNVDTVRLSIIPPGCDTWMKFSLERGGGTSDMRVAGQVRLPAGDWEPEWRHAVRIIPLYYFAANIWEGEIAIPWSTLEMAAPEPGTEMPFQFTRYAGNVRRTAELNDRITTWAPVSNVWHVIVPDTFGRLVFAGDAPVFRFDDYADSGIGEIGVAGELTRPDPEAVFSARCWHMSDYQRVFAQETRPCDDGVDWRALLDVTADTPVMMDWTITDRSGEVAGGRLLAEISPRFRIEAAPIYSRETVAVTGDLSRLEIGADARVVCRLADASGRVAATRTQPLRPGAKYFEEAVPMAQLPAGTAGTLEVALMQGASELHRYTQTIANPPRPEWMNRRHGEVTAPPPGWERPVIELDAEGIDFRVLDNRYRFGKGPLPEAIDIRGEAFSAGAMTFTVATEAGGVQELRPTAPTEYSDRDERGITLTWRGASAEVALEARIRLEFDGLAWYEWTFTPLAEGVVVTELGVSLPARPERVRYLRGLNGTGMMTTPAYFAMVGEGRLGRDLAQPDLAHPALVSGDGWTFQDSFVNFLWLGGGDRGMYFVIPSAYNMNVRDKYTDTVDTGDRFELRLNFIDAPTPFVRPLEYELATILTPSKRPRDVSRLWRVGAAFNGLREDGGRSLEQTPETYAPFGKRFFHDPGLRPFDKDYFTTAMLMCWKVVQSQNGNPAPPEAELERIDTEVAAIRDTIGGMPMLWYDSLFTMYHLPRALPYVEEWECRPRTRLPVEQLGTFVCATEAWSDYYLSGVIGRMAQGVESFYMDMSGFHACTNRLHGCGRRDPDTGEVVPRIRFLDGREMFLRYQNLVKANHPDGLLVMHTSLSTPLALWLDVLTDGEGWTNAPDYSTLLPEFYQFAQMGTLATGTVCDFFPGLILVHYPQAAKCDVTLAEVCGMTFSHGESMWNGVAPQLGGLRLVWDALDDFGVNEPDAEWIPYWDNPVSAYPDGVIVSEWRRNGESMLVVFNPHYEARRLDLGAFAGRAVRDEIAGTEWSDFTPSVAGRDFKLLRVR